MENHSSVTGCKSCFSHTNPSNFRRSLKSLLLIYMAENLHVTRSRLLNRNRNRLLMLPNFDMLLQLVPLPEIRVTDQISSTANFKAMSTSIRKFFFPQIFFCGCENCRVHTQRIRIVFSRPHVSDCIRKFSGFL